jgi:hypothetical protein
VAYEKGVQMRDSEAITAARQAVDDATNVGGDRQTLQQELERRIEEEPELFEAFALAGQAMLQTQQEQKH